MFTLFTIIAALLVGACDEAHGEGEKAEVQAIAYGAGGCGKLQGGLAMPCSGKNFEAFSKTACVLGRNYLHPLAVETILDSYDVLSKEIPTRRWQYGDLGWKNGGKLEPHRTHQNGLSADFFMPVLRQRKPAKVPISASNKFGYDIEFGRDGTYEDLEIDWRAVALHLLKLIEAGKKRGVSIERIFFAPDLQDQLLAAHPKARMLRPLLNRKQAWVRHDEHYHVDFDLPALYRRPLKCD